MTFLRMLRLRFRSLFHRRVVERELDDEVRFHIDMQAEENVRAGMSPAEARRQAVLRFGGVEGHKEEVRRVQGVELMGARVSWLDLKLGLRMLTRHTGLSLAGGLAIMIAVGFSAAYFEFVNDFVNPRLPLDEGDRIVGIQSWSTRTATPEPATVATFIVWRGQLRSVEDVGAFTVVQRNLIADDGGSEPVEVAEISASAFRLARVPPLLGRTLLEADEREGAADVLVIGHEIWQSRFDGDPDVIGRIVGVGAVTASVVGVMPEGFGFPVNHRLWMPLRLDDARGERPGGSVVQVFGRLAPGVSMDGARAELATIEGRSELGLVAADAGSRGRIVPYVESVVGPASDLYLTHAAILLILAVVCANVATLLHTRTATRVGELTLRTALGATRSRIVIQLFVEALVLASVASVLGLAAVSALMNRGMARFWELQGGDLSPFWWDNGLSLRTIVYVAVLAVFGAAIIGVLPAFKVTGHRIQPAIQRLGLAGSAMQVGRTWTGAIIVQVALSVAILPNLVSEVWSLRGPPTAAGIDADGILSARVEFGGDPGGESPGIAEADQVGATDRLAGLQEALKRRLLDEPGIDGVTMASRLPGMSHPTLLLEVADAAIPAASRVNYANVDPDYFDTLGLQIIAGRAFNQGDRDSGNPVTIVDQAFVDRYLVGISPLGKRVRFATQPNAEPGPWREIVGVAANAAMTARPTGGQAGVYLPIAPGRTGSIQIAARVDPSREAFAQPLHAAALAVDPEIRVYDVRPLAAVGEMEAAAY